MLCIGSCRDVGLLPGTCWAITEVAIRVANLRLQTTRLSFLWDNQPLALGLRSVILAVYASTDPVRPVYASTESGQLYIASPSPSPMISLGSQLVDSVGALPQQIRKTKQHKRWTVHCRRDTYDHLAPGYTQLFPFMYREKEKTNGGQRTAGETHSTTWRPGSRMRDNTPTPA